MALDEATTALLEQMAASGGRPLHELTPAEARGVMAAMRGEQAARTGHGVRPRHPGQGVGRVRAGPRPDPRARGRAASSSTTTAAAGCIGGLDDFDTLGRLLAQRTGCVVVLVDYRLAPEYRFPTAVDDAWAALRWADEHRAELAGRRGEPGAADRRRRQRGRQPGRGHGAARQGAPAARRSRCRCSSTR